jgi:hypothetical protein
MNTLWNAVCSPKSRINALDPEEVEKFRTGRLALVFNWLESHIQHVADKLLTASCPPAYLAMDEADAFWASFNPVSWGCLPCA